MTILLHPVPHAELEALAALHAACFPDDPWDGPALGTVLAMPGTGGRVARTEAGEAVGLLIDQCLGDDAEILTLGVLPSSRRRGVARALLSDLFSRARAAGATRIVLEVAADNEAARALYRALGFVHQGIRRGYYRRAQGPNVDAWRLSRVIAASRES
jgi:[ribosomal protein S18]-alanine N-acetyltransferase